MTALYYTNNSRLRHRDRLLIDVTHQSRRWTAYNTDVAIAINFLRTVAAAAEFPSL